jgi:hypothetical protein
MTRPVEDTRERTEIQGRSPGRVARATIASNAGPRSGSPRASANARTSERTRARSTGSPCSVSSRSTSLRSLADVAVAVSRDAATISTTVSRLARRLDLGDRAAAEHVARLDGVV